MAYFRKVKGGVRAEVRRTSPAKVYDSDTFPTMGEAKAWAQRREAEIRAGRHGDVPDLRFADLLDKYEREVSAHKKGGRWEAVRIGLAKRDPLAQVKLRKLSATDVAAWRDRRLKAVSGASVRREWNLLSSACSAALQEWHWLKANPFKEVKRPKEAAHRTRRAADDERRRLAEVATTPARRRVLDAFLFAEECAMRASEICSATLTSPTVAYLGDTKNGTSRLVPLSAKAIELYGDGFALTPASIDAIWRKMTKEAGIEDLHFHDSRREAVTRLSKKIDIYELARIVGHKNINQLLTYYHRSAEDLAKLL